MRWCGDWGAQDHAAPCLAQGLAPSRRLAPAPPGHWLVKPNINTKSARRKRRARRRTGRHRPRPRPPPKRRQRARRARNCATDRVLTTYFAVTIAIVGPARPARVRAAPASAPTPIPSVVVNSVAKSRHTSAVSIATARRASLGAAQQPISAGRSTMIPGTRAPMARRDSASARTPSTASRPASQATPYSRAIQTARSAEPAASAASDQSVSGMVRAAIAQSRSVSRSVRRSRQRGMSDCGRSSLLSDEQVSDVRDDAAHLHQGMSSRSGKAAAMPSISKPTIARARSSGGRAMTGPGLKPFIWPSIMLTKSVTARSTSRTSISPRA